MNVLQATTVLSEKKMIMVVSSSREYIGLGHVHIAHHLAFLVLAPKGITVVWHL